jgi:hypothetical protein
MAMGRREDNRLITSDMAGNGTATPQRHCEMLKKSLFVILDRLFRHAIHLGNWSEFS